MCNTAQPKEEMEEKKRWNKRSDYDVDDSTAVGSMKAVAR